MNLDDTRVWKISQVQKDKEYVILPPEMLTTAKTHQSQE